jgi:hypothetical protein
MVCGYRPDLVYHPGYLIFRESLSTTYILNLLDLRRTCCLDFPSNPLSCHHYDFSVPLVLLDIMTSDG